MQFAQQPGSEQLRPWRDRQGSLLGVVYDSSYAIAKKQARHATTNCSSPEAEHASVVLSEGTPQCLPTDDW